MPNMSPFDHRPDADLGRALRKALTPAGDAAFAQRVMAAAEVVYGERSPDQWWTVLTVWARPGLVAAMLIIAAVAFAAGIWVGQNAGAQSAATAMDPLRTDSEQLVVPSLLTANQAPDVDVVLAAALGR